MRNLYSFQTDQRSVSFVWVMGKKDQIYVVLTIKMTYIMGIKKLYEQFNQAYFEKGFQSDV